MEKAKLVKWCGTPYAVARAIGVHPSTVTRWKRWVPRKYHEKIREVTGFKG